MCRPFGNEIVQGDVHASRSLLSTTILAPGGSLSSSTSATPGLRIHLLRPAYPARAEVGEALPLGRSTLFCSFRLPRLRILRVLFCRYFCSVSYSPVSGLPVRSARCLYLRFLTCRFVLPRFLIVSSSVLPAVSPSSVCSCPRAAESPGQI